MANVQDHEQIQSTYAEYRESIKEVSDSLKPFRPPTAPASDIQIERKYILETSTPKFLVVQIALAILVLVLLAYVLLPASAAHPIAMLLLAVGIAVGIFLRK